MLVCAVLSFGGCARKLGTPAPLREGSFAPAPADTLANGFPRAVAPKLASWFQLWQRAGTNLRADALHHGPSQPYAFQLAPVVHAGRWRDNVRTRAGIEVLAPDSLHAVDFDMELEVTREPDGIVRPERDVDSGPILADFARDSLWIVDFCGTPCGFDGAAWLDASRFVVVGTTQTGAGMDGPWAAFVDLYDLQRRTMTRWLSSPVTDARLAMYSNAAESTLAARLAAAGADVPEGRAVVSRALDQGTDREPRSGLR